MSFYEPKCPSPPRRAHPPSIILAAMDLPGFRERVSGTTTAALATGSPWSFEVGRGQMGRNWTWRGHSELTEPGRGAPAGGCPPSWPASPPGFSRIGARHTHRHQGMARLVRTCAHEDAPPVNLEAIRATAFALWRPGGILANRTSPEDCSRGGNGRWRTPHSRPHPWPRRDGWSWRRRATGSPTSVRWPR